MTIQNAINAALFVQFVYDNWGTDDGSNNLDGRPVVTAAGDPIVPVKKYTVLKTIYANDLATVLSPNKPILEGYKTIGIVAANDADAKDIYVAIRGTETVWDWIQDLNFLMKPFSNVSGSGLTEDGFTDMYQSFSFTAGVNQGPAFIQNLAALIAKSSPQACATIAGHSLGSSLATLLALDLSANTPITNSLYTLASPRTGDLTFSHLFNHVVPNAYRIVNRLDLVPKTPPPLLYWHVGDETELIPGPDLKFDLKCEHILTTYLHLLGAVNGTPSLYPLDPQCAKSAAGPA
jgi:triacylglycerol lipase